MRKYFAIGALVFLTACGGVAAAESATITTKAPSTTTTTTTINWKGVKAIADAQYWTAVKVWVDGLNWQGLAHWPKPPSHTTTHHSYSTKATVSLAGHTPCAIPDWICTRESGPNWDIHAQNPSSSASGKYQITHDTWGGYGGYSEAKYAPEEVQDAKAASMALCNWQPPNYCA